MGWANAIGLGLSLIGGNQQRKANNKAAAAISNAANQSNQFAMGQYAPYTGLGSSAAGSLSALNGGNLSGFLNSPDYQAAYTEGLKGLDRSAAARGSLYSGGHSADLLRFGSGLASQYLNQYRNNLLGQAQLGAGAASGLSSLYGKNLMTGAGAQYDRIQQNASVNQGLLGSFGNAAGQYFGGMGSGLSGWGFSPIPVGQPDLSLGQPTVPTMWGG